MGLLLNEIGNKKLKKVESQQTTNNETPQNETPQNDFRNILKKRGDNN